MKTQSGSRITPEPNETEMHENGVSGTVQLTFLVHCLTVLTSSVITRSTHFWHGSLILPI